jgi:hypothetical protein
VTLLIADKPEDHGLLDVMSPSAVPTAVHNETFTPLQHNPEDNEAELEPDSYYDKDDCSIQEYEIMKVWTQAQILIYLRAWYQNMVSFKKLSLYDGYC